MEHAARECLSSSWEGGLAVKGLCKAAVLMLAQGQLTQEEGMGNTVQAGRGQSQGKNNALLTYPSPTPLGRKALLKLQSSLPESLNCPRWTSLHKQGLGVPPARTAGRDTKDKEWSRQLKQRTPRAGSGQGLADGIIKPSVTVSQACSPTHTDFKQSLASRAIYLLQQIVLPVLTEIWLKKKRETQHQPSCPPPCSHDPFQSCHGHKCRFLSHITATAPLLSVLSWHMKKCGLVVSLLHRYLLLIPGKGLQIRQFTTDWARRQQQDIFIFR